METKELKIQIPEGYCIDESKSTFEKIVFKKKDKPRSWEEYCKNHEGDFYFITSDSNISGLGFNPRIKNPLDVSTSKNTLPSKELAEAFLAMMQLMSLRQAWIGYWKPDWNNYEDDKWGIVYHDNKPAIGVYGNSSRALSFPTEEMATDFMNTFKDLLEVAKPLI